MRWIQNNPLQLGHNSEKNISKMGGSSHYAIAKVLDSDLEVRDFELQSRY